VATTLEQHRLRPTERLESEVKQAAARAGLSAGTDMLIDDRGNMRWLAWWITQRGALREAVTADGVDDVDEAWRVAFMKFGLDLMCGL
jgi:hypothetical protein